jgi:hypothetical protein
MARISCWDERCSRCGSRQLKSLTCPYCRCSATGEECPLCNDEGMVTVCLECSSEKEPGQ